MAEMRKGERTREHILKTTRSILVAQGFHNTTINDIIRATGVKKGNLYYHFASKEEIGIAVLQDASREFLRFLEDSFQGPTACAKVINSCQAIFLEQQKNNFVGGCLFGNAALEMSDSNRRFAAVIQDVFSQWCNKLAGALMQAGESGCLAASLPPHLLAKAIVATMEGGIMMARVSKDPADLADCLAVIKSLVSG